MDFSQTTLATPELNLAADESLLVCAEEAEQQASVSEVLRVWQADETFIVLGRGSKVEEEVFLNRADELGVPVLRRITGGATVLAAPGCMFYSVLLSLEQNPGLSLIDRAHAHVMGKIAKAVQPFVPDAHLAGTCDLVVDGRKVSGNALRIGRRWLLYHGTLLLDMNLELLEQYLRHPPREPDYREQREHSEFVANLQIPMQELCNSLCGVWRAKHPESEFLHEALNSRRLEQLVMDKYGRQGWNRQR